MSHTPNSSKPSRNSVAHDSRKEESLVRLYTAGDATIVVRGSHEKGERRFLVSSETLSVASPYFKALFSPSFKEGLSMRPGTCPEIILEEDDTEAMEILLSILHFHDLDKYQSLEPKTIATVAVQSDKYDCTHALVPWAYQWLHDVGILTSPEEYGFLMTAAYLLDSAYYFKSVSAMAIRHMAPDDLQNKVRLSADTLQNELYSTEKILTEGEGSGHRATGYCTREQRIADFLSEIHGYKLWPSVEMFRTMAVIDIGHCVELAVFKNHECDGEERCPLKRELKKLPERLNRIIAEVEGVSMEQFTRNQK